VGLRNGICGGKLVLVLAWLILVPAILFGQESSPDFNRDIRPILSDRCFPCHGPDSAANHSGLRLDIGTEAIDWGAFVPHDPDSSAAMERIRSKDDTQVMPPPASKLSLTADEISLLEKWVGEGAKYDRHWAFKELPDSVAVPDTGDSTWPRDEIDRFVLQRLQQESLDPSGEAERWRWLRRVTFDLTGLPPTAEEIGAFENDQSENAHEKVVDRLLDSPRYGERMAVPWLDAARYADSFGYQSDLLSPTWPWRDWVVRALNDNLPYDKFLAWQLAGDLLPNATNDQILATGFNRLHRMTNEGGSVHEEWRLEYVADRVNTFGTSILGLTIECARCHDHKFDPVSQRDYYNLSAFFNSIDEAGTYLDSVRVPTPSLLLPTEEQQTRMNSLAAELADVREAARSLVTQLSGQPFAEWRSTAAEIRMQLPAVARWSMDALAEDNSIPADWTPDAKLAADGKSELRATTSTANRMVEGRFGKALQLTGDDGVNFPQVAGKLDPWEPYSISLWMRIPNGLNDAVILHRQSGTDVGMYGTELVIRDNRLQFASIRFWPGNALAIASTEPLPVDEWVHVAICNDGSGTAAGMKLFTNGVSSSHVLQDSLTKSPGVGDSGFVVGERFRAPGLKDSQIDELNVFGRALTAMEVRTLFESGDQVADLFVEGRLVPAGRFEVKDLLEQFLQQDESLKSLRDRERQLVQQELEQAAPVNETMVMREQPSPRPAWVLHRGEYDAPRTDANLAERLPPAEIMAFTDELSRDRLGLAQWLTAANHPLGSRVAVNRIWQMFFGTGLVGTSNNFGLQGEMPSHPELLDWLSRDFVDHQWDLKRLCKKIVLSATYRQDSATNGQLISLDPENRLLARGPAKRLSAEMIRDLALAASGLLDEKRGGPPVSPYQPADLWTENNSMTPGYQQSTGSDLYRRSLYTVWKRTTPMPNLTLFDATSREVCTIKRSDTSTPLQSLVLLNDIQFVEAARVMAEKAVQTHPDQADGRLSWIFVRLTGRNCTEQEMNTLRAILDGQAEYFGKEPEQATKLLSIGDQKPVTALDPIQVAATTIVVQAVLNADVSIWRR